MLKVTAEAVDPREVAADLLVVPVFKGGIGGPGTALVLEALGLDTAPVTPGFRGDIGQHLRMAAPGIAAGGILLVGLGRMDETDPERLRHAAGVAAGASGDARRVATTLAEVHPSGAATEAVAEGFQLGAYRDDRHRSRPRDADQRRLTEVVVLAPSSRLWEARLAIKQADVYARATVAARDLVNLPPDRKRPTELAQRCADLAGAACEAAVLDEDALAREGFGGHLAVAAGSGTPPRLVRLRYRPASPIGRVVLVGEGITFDSGGLSLSRDDSMQGGKAHMAGAAAVASACSVLGELGVRLEVVGLLALAENMPGSAAQRPGDVVTLHGGTTAEVRDTDAPGRLVLADALAYGAELGADAMVDCATLTRSAVTALGQYAAALVGNDEELVASIRQAADVAGEEVGLLPLWARLQRLLDSSVADLNNTGDGAGGGAITAGLFLQRFAGETPWAHLDIAGPAFLSPALAEGYLPPGGTGFATRTLLAWLERRAS